MATRSRPEYQSIPGHSGTAPGDGPVAIEATAGEPMGATVRALPGGGGNRRETGALDVQTESPASLSGTMDRSTHSNGNDNRPYLTVRHRRSLGVARPTSSLRDDTRHVVGSPTGPEKFPGWFSEGDEPTSSLKDVTLLNNNIFPEMETQTQAERAFERTSPYYPQVPQLEFKDFAEEVMSGLKDFEPVPDTEVTYAAFSLETNATRHKSAELPPVIPMETAIPMGGLAAQQIPTIFKMLEGLTNHIIVLNARVSSYETILNRLVAPRDPQHRPNQKPVSTIPLQQRISRRQRHVPCEPSNISTSGSRRHARRELGRAQADHRNLVERLHSATTAPAMNKRTTLPFN